VITGQLKNAMNGSDGSTHCVHNSPEDMFEMFGGTLKLENVEQGQNHEMFVL
jgi:hypothetical protein